MNHETTPSSESNDPSKWEPAVEEFLDLLARLLARKHFQESNPHRADAPENATDSCRET